MKPTDVHRRGFLIVTLVAAVAWAAPARAQSPSATTAVCVSIDEARDTLSPADRTAARLLVVKQFELEGWPVVADGCANAYRLSHVALGHTMTVTLAGAAGRREGTAHGLDDLPALYSQIVRSLVTGRPMIGMNVVDRTNVTSAQAAPPRRVSSDSFGYARIGFGSSGGGFGFGRRAEFDGSGFDISFLNVQHRTGARSGYYADSTTDFSWVKLQWLHFRDTAGNGSAYFGGGASWGGTGLSEAASRSSWSGGGLRGELTGGYEWGRASTVRMFLQADAVLPFYTMRSPTRGARYAASLTVSVGLGWQRARR